MESTLFLYFLFHLLSEAFYYENNLSFDIVLIAKPKLRRDYIFMIHQEQLRFNKKIKFNFKGGDLTSDAGLLLIQEFMYHMKFPELLKQYFYLETDQAIRTHTNHDLCLQQIYQTIAGYHCADDADELRVDPLLTTLLDKPSLASQPTLSRFTHRLTKETSNLNSLIKNYYRNFIKSKRLIILFLMWIPLIFKPMVINMGRPLMPTIKHKAFILSWFLME